MENTNPLKRVVGMPMRQGKRSKTEKSTRGGRTERWSKHQNRRVKGLGVLEIRQTDTRAQ